MEEGFLFKKVKPINLDAKTIEGLIEKIEEKGKLTEKGRKAIPSVLTHANIMFKKFKVVGQLFFLRADTVRTSEGFDEELDSIQTYLEGDNSPDGDGRISDVRSEDMAEKITRAFLDLYLKPYNLSPEEIEDYTDQMRLAMKHEGL